MRCRGLGGRFRTRDSKRCSPEKLVSRAEVRRPVPRKLRLVSYWSVPCVGRMPAIEAYLSQRLALAIAPTRHPLLRRYPVSDRSDESLRPFLRFGLIPTRR